MVICLRFDNVVPRARDVVVLPLRFDFVVTDTSSAPAAAAVAAAAAATDSATLAATAAASPSPAPTADLEALARRELRRSVTGSSTKILSAAATLLFFVRAAGFVFGCGTADTDSLALSSFASSVVAASATASSAAPATAAAPVTAAAAAATGAGTGNASTAHEPWSRKRHHVAHTQRRTALHQLLCAATATSRRSERAHDSIRVATREIKLIPVRTPTAR